MRSLATVFPVVRCERHDVTQSRSELIPIGDAAPDFTAAGSDGSSVQLSALRGRKRVVLVFYPGDNTPVCTAQLCAFRDSWEALQAEDTVVYGINPAGEAKHARFAERQQFPFPLLADEGGKIAALYGCRGLFGFVKRTVYGIDEEGRVVFAQRGNPPPLDVLRAFEGAR